MLFEKRYVAAFKELEAAGLRKPNQKFPLERLYRKVGLKVRPVEYQSLFANFLFSALYFGSIWGGFKWFFVYSPQGMVPLTGFIMSVLAGASFGVFNAILYGWRVKKHNLSKWESLV